jgi:hypothetical protein
MSSIVNANFMLSLVALRFAEYNMNFRGSVRNRFFRAALESKFSRSLFLARDA